MKTIRIDILKDSDEALVNNLLDELVQKGVIKRSGEETNDVTKSEPASEEQVQEIIDEAELGPFYSENQAKDILNL